MRKARIALARRLVIIMHAMLWYETEFVPAYQLRSPIVQPPPRNRKIPPETDFPAVERAGRRLFPMIKCAHVV
jgi:hypothetical protein